MSRGPGRIERTIAEIFAANPDKGFTVRMLCGAIWDTEPSHSKRSSVLRAAGKVAKRLGWTRFSFHEQQNETCFIAVGNPLAKQVSAKLSNRAIACALNVNERS